MRILLFLVIAAFFSSPLGAQKRWTLQECISYALANNIGLKQTALNNEMNHNMIRQSKAGTLPSLNANAAHVYNVGKSIDRFTNTFANSTVLSQNFFLSSSITLWSGLSQHHNIRSNQYTYLSGVEQLKQQEYDLSLGVANAYIAVIFSEELLKISENQFRITEEQLERTDKMVKAGAIARSVAFDIRAQLANDEVNVTEADNNRTISLLNLQQLMNLDSVQDFGILRPDLEVSGNELLNNDIEGVYQGSLKIQPIIRSGEFSIRSAESVLAANRGRISPSLTFNANIGTGTSGLAVEQNTASILSQQPIAVTGRGDIVYVPVYDTRPLPFSEQFKENVSKSIGFTLTVPLLNGLQTHTSIQNAKLNAFNAKLSQDLQKQNLYKNIAQAMANAKAALNKYHSNILNVQAAGESFKYAQEKFNAGVISAFDFSTSKNRLFAAESNLLQSKYDYIFKLKVLDYYQGKPLDL
jgi:outer membrane protein